MATLPCIRCCGLESFSDSKISSAMPVCTTSGKESSRMNGEEESSNSEEESSSFDEDESERRKGDCLEDIQFLEQQFSDLKELLYQERLEEIDYRIQTVTEGNADEYLHPQKDLQRTLSRTLETADTHLECKIRNIDNKYQEEAQAAEQDFKELCEMTRQKMKAEITEKISHLEDSTILTQESSSKKRKLKPSEFQFLAKRKKPINVIGPYVVYMLRDTDILQDLADITKGIAGEEEKWPPTKTSHVPR